MNFTLQEYSTRINNVKKSMSKKGLELLIISDPSNMNYLTGYDGWSFYVPQGVIVALDKDEPIWFGRKQDSKGAMINSIKLSDQVTYHSKVMPSFWQFRYLTPSLSSGV